MNSDEILTGLASKVFGLDETGVASLKNEDGSFKEDAFKKLSDHDAERIAKINTAYADKEVELRRDHYSRGERETKEKAEKAVKDKYGLKSDKKLLEMIDDLVAAKSAKAAEIGEDDVKKHKSYLTLESEYTNFKTTAEQNLKTEVDRIKAEQEQERTMSHVLSRGKSLINAMKPILSADPDKAARQLQLAENDLKGYRYQAVEGNDNEPFLILKADGSRLDDQHGHPMKFSAFVKGIGEKYYDFQVSDKRTSEGTPDKGSKTSKLVLTKPASKEEYTQKLAEIMSLPDKEERMKLSKEYRALYEGAG